MLNIGKDLVTWLVEIIIDWIWNPVKSLKEDLFKVVGSILRVAFFFAFVISDMDKNRIIRSFGFLGSVGSSILLVLLAAFFIVSKKKKPSLFLTFYNIFIVRSARFLTVVADIFPFWSVLDRLSVIPYNVLLRWRPK